MAASKLSAAIEAVNQVATKEPIGGDVEEKTKFVTIRLRESEYDRIKKLFGSQGLPLATGCTMSTLWIADELQRGNISMSKGGIKDNRR
jgi:hypothetical protein